MERHSNKIKFETFLIVQANNLDTDQFKQYVEDVEHECGEQYWDNYTTPEQCFNDYKKFAGEDLF